MTDTILLTGATGYVGSHLLEELLRRGHTVRTLAPDPLQASLPDGVEAVRGDAVPGEGLAQALEGVRTDSGAAARDAGVGRTIYLGGLGVLTYREMKHRYARLAARRASKGGKAEMIVESRPPPGSNDDPLGFDGAVREVLG